MHADRPVNIDTHVEALRSAETVAFGGVGITGAVLPVTESYLALLAAGPSVRPRLTQLLDSATPAGRVYAAHLLADLDPAAGRAAWQRLAEQPGEVSTFQGCFMDRTSLHEYASARLER